MQPILRAFEKSKVAHSLPQTTAQHPGNTTHTTKDSIILWVCFSAERTGNVNVIKGIMGGSKYKQILEENLFQSARNLY